MVDLATPRSQDWRYTQKYIRIEHNKQVKAWFKNSTSGTGGNLRNAILIYPKDTANQILVKIQFFTQYVSRQHFWNY